MLEDKDIFVVAKGLLSKKLYLSNSLYSIYPSTTENLLNAKFFENYELAEKAAKKSGIGSSIYHFKLCFVENDSEKAVSEENKIYALQSLIYKLEKENEQLKKDSFNRHLNELLEIKDKRIKELENIINKMKEGNING